MGYIGDGISSPAIEQDASIAQLQAQAVDIQAAAVSLPATGFVASINSLTGLLTLQSGTSSPGVTITVSSDGVSTISIGITGISSTGTAKNNITAAPPNPSNDEFEGYATFSLWIDNTLPLTPDIYICASSVTAAAVWVKLN